jgi:hypothetical protein
MRMLCAKARNEKRMTTSPMASFVVESKKPRPCVMGSAACATANAHHPVCFPSCVALRCKSMVSRPVSFERLGWPRGAQIPKCRNKQLHVNARGRHAPLFCPSGRSSVDPARLAGCPGLRSSCMQWPENSKLQDTGSQAPLSDKYHRLPAYSILSTDAVRGSSAAVDLLLEGSRCLPVMPLRSV